MGEKMKQYFEITPTNDKDGVLQDVHWSHGSFGYFPTYALGTIYATQLYNTLKKEFSDIEKDVERGDYARIKEWLLEKVHKRGARYFAEDLMKKICGEGLNPDIYTDYLNKKYSEIYNIS